MVVNEKVFLLDIPDERSRRKESPLVGIAEQAGAVGAGIKCEFVTSHQIVIQFNSEGEQFLFEIVAAGTTQRN